MRGRVEQPACLDPGFCNGNDPSSRSGQAAGEDRHTRAGERTHDSVSELIVRVEQNDLAEKPSAAALARSALIDGRPGPGVWSGSVPTLQLPVCPVCHSYCPRTAG